MSAVNIYLSSHHSPLARSTLPPQTSFSVTQPPVLQHGTSSNMASPSTTPAYSRAPITFPHTPPSLDRQVSSRRTTWSPRAYDTPQLIHSKFRCGDDMCHSSAATSANSVWFCRQASVCLVAAPLMERAFSYIFILCVTLITSEYGAWETDWLGRTVPGSLLMLCRV